jgi:alkanesulfonate monooxygenase SsuD/methylene tetrahydromethanopterin reductase-like flavin-dependent oxidoreductase (luciferase family)
VHIISGGSDADQAKDGDWTDAGTRYRRTAEYVGLLRRTWTEPAPFNYEGEFFRTRGTYAEIRCRQEPHVPVYGGGGLAVSQRFLAATAEDLSAEMDGAGGDDEDLNAAILQAGDLAGHAIEKDAVEAAVRAGDEARADLHQKALGTLESDASGL